MPHGLLIKAKRYLNIFEYPKIKMLIRSKKKTAMEYLDQVSEVVPEFGTRISKKKKEKIIH